jgi:hypothetical protein
MREDTMNPMIANGNWYFAYFFSPLGRGAGGEL